MNLLITMLIVTACISLSAQDIKISSFGAPHKNREEFYRKITKKSRKFGMPANFTLEFDIDFGNRKFSTVEFTTPEKKDDIIINSNGRTLGLSRIVQKFEIYNAKEFQIDATAYIQPLQKRP